ncbi:MAG: serine hydrolase [Cyanobacteria bacterium J06621_15]
MNPKINFTTEPELLIEAEETVSLLNFNLSEPPSESGTVVSINAPNLSDFNLTQTQVEGGEITLEPELEQQLNDALDATRVEEVPGAAVAIVSPFGSWFGTSGVANVENDTPLQPDDRFPIGSITKTFVATTVLQLVEEGQLSLSDTLTTWLPESVTADIPNAEDITLEQLLQHTSGVADYIDVLFNQGATNPGIFLTDLQPEELVDFIDGVEPLFSPGESWQYSNTNFILAGLVVEAATGNNIADEIRTRIIEPLNLENTFFAEEEEIPGGYVSGYWDFNQDGTLDNITSANLSWAWATGAMVSNTVDLDTFARSLFKGELLEPETLEQMLDTIPAIDNNNYSSYGLGVGTIESPNRFWYIHRGLVLGYRSNMWYSPQDDFTYIELINGFSDDNLVRDLLPPFRVGINDEAFDFTITEQSAQISLPVLNDGEIEGEETATFTVENGEGYEVDSNANSGSFTIVDSLLEPPAPLPNVALGAFPDRIAEDENDILTLFFEVDNLPQDGLYVYVDSETPQSLSQFELTQAVINGGESLIVNPDLSGFAVKIFADDASIEIPVAVDDIKEPIIDITYELKTREEISEEDLAAIETVDLISDYVINPQMVGETITVFDTFGVDESEIPVKPEPIFGSLEGDIIEVSGSGGLIFGGDSDDLIDASISNQGNNRIYAGSGDDTVILGMSDRIVGGTGDDKFFTTNGGDNIITGGAGADQFWIATAEIPEAVNIITDFTSGEDVLGIAGLGIGFDDLSITQQDNNTLIAVNGSDLAILQGIATDSLIADNFAFV